MHRNNSSIAMHRDRIASWHVNRDTNRIVTSLAIPTPSGVGGGGASAHLTLPLINGYRGIKRYGGVLPPGGRLKVGPLLCFSDMTRVHLGGHSHL